MAKNQSALDCGLLARKMAEGYYVHAAALGIARDKRAPALMPPIESGQIVPIGRVLKLDGTEHLFHYPHFLLKASSDPMLSAEIDQVWLKGALLAVGDAISVHGYFDRAPELELLRHLRNGIAHGNHFRIDKPAALAKYPAHNRLAHVKSHIGTIFEITPNQQGQEVLFSFMGAGDVLDLIISVDVYLSRIGNGEPLRP